MPKQYQAPRQYEAKLGRVMERLGVERYDYDWSRSECWVEFTYRGCPYRFTHSVENAKAHGAKIQYGSDALAQVVLSLEDLARMVERGIYDLSTWVAGMRYLPAAPPLPSWCQVLQFETLPTKVEEIDQQFKRLAKVAHPDVGGTDTQFRVLTEARAEGLAYIDAKTEKPCG